MRARTAGIASGSSAVRWANAPTYARLAEELVVARRSRGVERAAPAHPGAAAGTGRVGVGRHRPELRGLRAAAVDDR